MAAHDQLYDTIEDCRWIRETALKGYDVPLFRSFTIAGNEDCPLEITLYPMRVPLIDTIPVARYELRQQDQSTLSEYVRATD